METDLQHSKMAMLEAGVLCPECGSALWKDKRSMQCLNEDCRLYKLQYHRLTVELKEIKE